MGNASAGKLFVLCSRLWGALPDAPAAGGAHISRGAPGESTSRSSEDDLEVLWLGVVTLTGADGRVDGPSAFGETPDAVGGFDSGLRTGLVKLRGNRLEAAAVGEAAAEPVGL